MKPNLSPFVGTAKICPGALCTYDPDNTTKQSESGVHHVVVIGKVDRKHFSTPAKWSVVDADAIDTAKSFICDETLLKPIYIVAVRYPVGYTSFSDADANTVSKAVALIKHLSSQLGPDSMDDDDKETLSKLDGIGVKIQFLRNFLVTRSGENEEFV